MELNTKEKKEEKKQYKDGDDYFSSIDLKSIINKKKLKTVKEMIEEKQNL